jgi:glycosyltransferase involved in cell wall biosynthesis
MKIVILAQTPPPYHGQSIMFSYLAEVSWDWCDKQLIRLDYSSTVAEVGKFSLKKVMKLFYVVLRVWKQRIKGKIDILFYPPAGSNRIPFYRDVVTLALIKWCSKKIIFHFHAGGFDLLYKEFNPFEKFLASAVYKNSDAAIVLAENLRNEVNWSGPKRIYIIPNAVKDNFVEVSEDSLRKTKLKVLTVGLLSESKGIFIAVDAARILKNKGFSFEWNFIGSWISEEVRRKFNEEISNTGLNNLVCAPGELLGDNKWKIYSDANIFCFPTFYENEAMPLVILEAMMMSLPIVTTNWRAIPSIIDDNLNGLLVPVKDSKSLAEALERIITDDDLRQKLSLNAREKYLREFTIEKHLSRVEIVFKEVAELS